MKDFLVVMRFEYGEDAVCECINCDFLQAIQFIELPKAIKRLQDKYNTDDLDYIVDMIEDARDTLGPDEDLFYEIWSSYWPLSDSHYCYDLTSLEIFRVTDHETII